MSTAETKVSPDAITFGPDGLIPAVCRDAQSGDVLTLAFMDRQALAKTLETGNAWFWSRSRRALWHKGATSGNFLRVRSISVNCDENSLLLEVEPAGPACHTGNRSCFFRELDWSPKE